MSDSATRAAIARGKPISAKRAAALLAERDAALSEAAQWRETNSLAAQALTQKDGQIAELERQLSVLQSAARPAATILFNIAQQPGIEPRIVETIQQTLAPLDAALAATKVSAE